MANTLKKKWTTKKEFYSNKLAAIVTGHVPLSSSSISQSTQEHSLPARDRLAKSARKSMVDDSEDDDGPDYAGPHEEVTEDDNEGDSKDDDEEEEFGGALKKKKVSSRIISSPALKPAPLPVPDMELEPDPEPDLDPDPEPDLLLPEKPSLILHLNSQMDDKEALLAALEAAWQYLSENDSGNVFTVAVCDIALIHP